MNQCLQLAAGSDGENRDGGRRIGILILRVEYEIDPRSPNLMVVALLSSEVSSARALPPMGGG